jgi:diguanylate cyclase (GGDEF)-like protein
MNSLPTGSRRPVNQTHENLIGFRIWFHQPCGGLKRAKMLDQLMRRYVDVDLTTAFGRALIEERYWSLRRQVPIVYLLGFVNLSGMEMATTGRLFVGLNLPTFIAVCGILRLAQWFGSGSRRPTHKDMVKRMKQTVWFAAAVCIAVCSRCIYLLDVGDSATHMAVMLFGGLTAIGVSYGLTALPVAARIPLVLIIVPISAAAILSRDPHFAWAAFGLVVVSGLTVRLVGQHSRHFSDVIRSRSTIARQQELAEHAHQEAVVAATTDFLTGLPNRRAFVAALESKIAERSNDDSFAVAILDLDRFKFVNDTFGHGAGDKLLQEVAARLVRAVGRCGLVARLGGDEFGVVLPSVRSSPEAQAIGAQILMEVNRAVSIDGREFAVSACCGFGLSRPGGDKSPSRVMADADLALYQAKGSPTGAVAVFELRMEAPRQRRCKVERALQSSGIEENLHVVFQPIVHLATGRVIAHEALARWTDPELGPVSPSEFVPIAEQLNLIDDINRHLMAKAFEKARAWPDEVKLSFNLSAVQLCSSGSAKAMLKILDGAGLRPGRLQVEVTETALLADFERARENLTQLRKAGVTIVLDDFGAGFASIGYLRELRFDQIKLDGALVTAALDSADGKRLLRAVIALCEILGVSSVAEHIESEAILRLLAELGCTAGQGFWLQPPVPAEEISNLASIGDAGRGLLRSKVQRRAA